MEVVVARAFMKDLRTKPVTVARAVEQLIAVLEGADSLDSSGVDYKKMEGQKRGEHYYRIRLGEWRIGIEYIRPKVVMLRILFRGEVYKYFPPH